MNPRGRCRIRHRPRVHLERPEPGGRLRTGRFV